jgi:hypothetical protein
MLRPSGRRIERGHGASLAWKGYPRHLELLWQVFSKIEGPQIGAGSNGAKIRMF